MVDYIVLAEFDIEKGSGVRVQYPDTVPGTNAEELAEYMITEGAHNFGVVSTYFTVGKRACRDLLSEQTRMLQSPQNVFLDKIFTLESKQKLLEHFWLQEERSFTARQQEPTRCLPNILRNQQNNNNGSAASDLANQAQVQSLDLRYVAQKVKLYRIQNLKWIPYFSFDIDRKVVFQITCQNSQNFSIKLTVEAEDPSSAQRGPAMSTFAQNSASALNKNEFCIEIKVHPFLNFQASEASPHKATFRNVNGYVYGIEIINENVEERINLYKLMKTGLDFDPYKCFEYSLNQNEQTIYFQNLLKNRHDEQVKRGAIVKALAFGCRQKVLLEPFSQLIEVTLDAIISVTDLTAPLETNIAKYQGIIQQVHTQINQQASKLLVNRGNFLERAISQELGTNLAWKYQQDHALSNGGPSPDALYQIEEISIVQEPQLKLQTSVAIPLASPPDQVSSSSLVRIVNHLGTQIMAIYDAILTDKKIIFAGSRNLSITQIQNYMFAAASMVSPPLFGIHNKIMPYVPLVDMGKLVDAEGGFMAGVTNPMFIENRRCYDIVVKIDECKLKSNSDFSKHPYAELDLDFIRTLQARIKHDRLNDDEIRQAFQSYTIMMLDLATMPDSAGMTHKGVPVSQLYLNRTRKLKQTHLFKTHMSMRKIMDLDFTQSVSLANINDRIQTLRIKGLPHGPLTDNEISSIFKDIDTFVQDKTSVIKLLYMLPACRQGVGILAHGLFYDSDRVQQLAAKILLKIQHSCKAGALAVSRLSEFFQMRLLDVVAEIQEQQAEKKAGGQVSNMQAAATSGNSFLRGR